MDYSLYHIFEMLTLYPILSKKKNIYILCIETTFFQGPAKQFFPTGLNSQNQKKTPSLFHREN